MPAQPAAVPGHRDPRVDAYIAKAAPFAQPILEHIRAAMHAACPELDETIKWSRPFFELDGRVFGGMSAFKAHCALHFWRGGGEAVAEVKVSDDPAMGQFGHIRSIADLPTAPALRKIIAATAQEVRATRATAAAAPAPKKAPRVAPGVPDDLAAALRAQPPAAKHFAAFSPSQQGEYVGWIAEAKREATRVARVTQAIEWIAEGKKRNWKYER